MTGAPLPPHERAWRHPSEVGRVVHEPPSARSHAIIVSTAAVGLLLVALLVVAVTPGGNPEQVASPAGPGPDDASFATMAADPWTAAPDGASAPAATSATTAAGVADTAWTAVTASTGRSVATLVTATFIASTTTVVATIDGTVLDTAVGLETTAPAVESIGVAVPIESGAMALMTQPERTVSPGEAVTAELPTGDTVTAMVMATDESGLVVVSLPTDATESYPVAVHAVSVSAPDDTVHVHGAEPVTMEALGALDLADGTPLTDDAGNLVGLCVEDPASGATTMLVIDRARVDAIGG